MIDQRLLTELKDYIQRHLEETRLLDVCESSYQIDSEMLDHAKYSDLENYISDHEQPSFKEELYRIIDEKGLTDPEVYKKAGMDRKHFSKIRSKPDYRVGRGTAIALSLALQLDMTETEDLLASAGYFLSFSDTSDLVVRFCIEKRIYDLDYVNQALDSLNLKPLTG
ncbi:hypothetical protein V1502_03055 [Bacillus sp. SCS-153A]|uniref:hypothetical protein n=1 Tax=Rossellomorea sedimentorum TaxID=3115294 RepID=UPI003905D4B5